MAASQNYNVNLNIQANTSAAKQSLADLSAQLTKLSQGANLNLNAGKMTAEIQQASQAAMELQSHLQNATNAATGKLDFSKLNESIKRSNMTLMDYGNQLLKLGPSGQKAFAALATSISQAEVPLKRTSKLMTDFKTSLGNTIKWQISSSAIHGLIGGVQRAFGYAQDLNKSLTNIRIVTNQSTEQMANFALQANRAAKSLSTTTTEYTKASLIYYQQGLSDKEVQDRTNVTIKMANVTGQTAQTVSDQMTAVWNNYDNGSKSLTHYADVMTALGASTASSTDEIAQGLQKFASISNTVGLSYEYAASALATVTATTRESADVVGNAFKTLFSRIQGLQLGETLDDGTTLNKYSQGLAKVGIQIKDSAGEMKSMDTILDEMGNKWGTLAQDEKMALAQTVAGVRQYTQLMALMENWDFFKENLGIANTATGTLEAQQKIYEQSWEASNNRLRASFEGLWDSLINSDSFIAFTDTLSGIVDMFNSITKALGGGGGVLSLLGAGLTKIYSKDLVRGINDISYGIRNMFGKGGAREHIADLNSFVTAAQQRFQVTNDNANPELFENTPNMAAAFSRQIGESAFMGVNFSRFKDSLSLEQQAEFQNRMNLIQQLNARSSQYATQFDEQGALLADQASAVRRLIANTSGDTPEGQALNDNFNRYLYGRRAYGAANEYFGAGGLEHQVLLNNAGNPEAAMKAVRSGVTSFWNQFGGQLQQNFGSANFGQLMQNILDASDPTSMAAAVNTFMDTLGTQAEGVIPQEVQGALRDSIGQAGSTAQSQGASQAQYSASSNNTAGMAQKLVNDMLAASQKGSVGKTIVGSAQALMLLNSSISSLAGTLETLSSSAEIKQTDKISGVVNGLISTVTTMAFGISALAKIPGIPIQAKVIIGIIAAIVAAIPSISKAFDAMNQGSLESAVEQAEAMKRAYERVKNNDADLVKTITAYQEAQKALSSMTKGTEEWTQNLIKANEVAMKLISDHSISSEDYYRDAYGQIRISDEKLSQIEEDSRAQVLDAEMSKNLAENKVTKELYQEELRDFSMGLADTLVQKRDSLEAGKHSATYGGQTFVSYDSEEARAYDDFIEQNGTTRVTGGSGRSVSEEIDNRVKATTIEAAVNYLANNDGVFTTPQSFLDAGIGATATEAYLLAEHINELQEEAYRQQQRKNAIDLQYQDDAEKALADQTFKNAEVMSSAGLLLQNTEKQIEETAESNYQENWKQIAEDYAKKLGFTDNKDFKITDWGWDKSQISYQFRQLNEDGTQYETITGAFEKEDLIAFEKGQITREELIKSAQQLDANLTTIANSNQDYGGALSSFITRQNYTGATVSELNALLDALKAKDETTGKFKENVTDEEKKSVVADLFKQSGFTDGQGNLDTARLLAMAQSEGFATLDEYYKALYDRSVNSSKMLVQPLESSIKAKVNNDTFMSKYFGDLNIEDLQNLENTISNLNKTGSEHGNQYLEGLLNVLDKVQGVDDKGALLSELLKINPSDVSALSAIMAAVDMAGGSFTDAGAAAQAFTSAMAAIKPPDFNTLISQLEQIKALLGDVFNLKPGTNISKELFEQITQAFPELKNLFVEDLVTGGYNYIGSQETAREASRNAYAKNGEDIAAQEALAKKVGKSHGNLTWGEWAEDYGGDVVKETTQVESGNANWKTESGTQGGLTSANSIFGNIAKGQIDSDIIAAAQQYYGDEYEALFNPDTGMMARYDTAMNTMAQLVSEHGLETAKQMTEYQMAAADAAEASSQMLGFLQWLSDITGVDYNALQEEHEASKGSLAENTDQLAEMHGVDSSTMQKLSGEDGAQFLANDKNIQNYATQLANLGDNYAYSSEQATKLGEAMAEGNWELAAQLIPQTELATAIAQTAEARGLDAEVMGQTVSQLQSELNLVGATAQEWATLAAEQMEYDQAISELRDNYSELAKALDTCNEGSEEWNKAMVSLKKTLAKLLDIKDFRSLSDAFVKAAKNSGLLEKAARGDQKALADLRRASGLATVAIDALGKTQAEVDAAIESGGFAGLEGLFEGAEGAMANFVDNWNTAMDGLATMDVSEFVNSTEIQNALAQCVSAAAGGMASLGDVISTAEGMGFTPIITPISAEAAAESPGFVGYQKKVGDDENFEFVNNVSEHVASSNGAGQYYSVKFVPNGSGTGSGGGGGGGGGGGKEPKKVAQTRRSQVVKRYKNVDAKRSVNKSRRDNMSKKTDKLYGEAKITNLEKENKLLEEGLKLNRKKSEEAMKNLKIDQEAVVAMSQKYGYEVKFDSEGNLENYEEILGDLYDQLHELEADNLMDEAEEKVKEEIEIKREEIEGAIEDLEDTIKQLQELNDEYEEMIDEMHKNDLEKITYKLEFELELNELDTEWNDFLLEQIDNDFTQAAAIMDLVTDKAKTATENIEHYKQSVTDLIENIENDPNRSLITGYIEDGVLTDDEADIIKEAYSGIIEELSNLAEAKTTAEELLVSIFEGYNERIGIDMTALEHYSTLMEHFGNVVDIVGQKQLGLSNEFLENLSNMRAAQANDIISASKTNLEALYQVRADAEAELEKAREEGRTNDIDYWQERVDETNTAIQEAAEGVATALEESLTTIAEAFDASMQRIIDTFNDAIYAFGGLEGLSTDYSSIQEDVSLMAADYQKIYELSKLTRNINKTLNDSNIIAGKQKMLDLQKEINELQASGVEMSQYDLEYLQAKYELRLAEIELENAQNNKDTVRLSKDSEGNWSYVYTQNMDALDEAQQKYEDALYNMQKISYEYIDEMSQRIVQVSQDMMEEISNIDKSQFKNEIELMEEVNRIKAKYANSLGLSEDELNKALENNKELYTDDWQAYNLATGYGLSEAQDWIDSYRESTLGSLLGSESDLANYVIDFQDALDELTQSLRRVATDYYFNTEAAFAAAGMTKAEFASYVAQNSREIKKASNDSKKNIEEQTKNLVDEFGKQAGKVTTKQTELKTAIDTWGPYLKEIKDLLEESAKVTKDQQGKDATYTYKEAADLFNSKYSNGLNGFAGYTIEMNEEGVWSKGVDAVKNEILAKHSEAKTDEEKKYYADMYTWLTSYILPYTTSLDTGGYTGEWGNSGKLAMLHEKELVLNANDTSNFLDALQLSYDVINSMIEMNARASSMGVGNLTPTSVQENSQTLEQQVVITAEFPNATNHDEIEEAFNNLINTASQYANRYNL